ncbi:hypothetical protein [Mesorhizobium sp. IMUNJ 23232]|uniref:hypothetical protein n=1 Tax=Mesorhizobium sp. IMUNJ 23232 TaxID=3376064 RepID=UPI00378D3B47
MVDILPLAMIGVGRHRFEEHPSFNTPNDLYDILDIKPNSRALRSAAAVIDSVSTLPTAALTAAISAARLALFHSLYATIKVASQKGSGGSCKHDE